MFMMHGVIHAMSSYPDRLAAASYLAHLRRDSARFREVLAATDPGAQVPACPDWTATDLLWHLAEVQWFWAQRVALRPAAPPDDDPGPDRPADVDGLLKAFDAYSGELQTSLVTADPHQEAWTWSDDKTVGFIIRRQAHEALIHRLDAEQTAGETTSLDPELAADGVAEILDTMYGGEPPAWGSVEAVGGEVEVALTDVDAALRVQPGRFVGTDPEDGESYDEGYFVVVREPAEPAAATVTGAAGDMDAWLWNRRDDSGIIWTGDSDARERFLEIVRRPLT